MAKIKTTVILEEISESSDNVNWSSKGEHLFEIGTALQENGETAIVTFPDTLTGKNIALNEMEELLKAMQVCDRAIGD